MTNVLANLLLATAVAAPLLGLLGRWHWFFDLFNHFRPQETLFLFTAACLLWAFRRPRTALVAAAVWALCALTLAPYWVPRPAVSEDAPTIKILFSNVYTDNRDSGRLLATIATKAPDVVFVAEINARWKDELDRGLPGYPYRFAVPREDNFGIGVYSKQPITATAETLGRAGVPSLRCETRLRGRTAVLWATHPIPPIAGKDWTLWKEQLTNLGDRIAAEKDPTILVGDLNSTPWCETFRRVRGGRLTDAALGRGLRGTFPVAWPSFMRVPIDNFLHSREFGATRREILPSIGSDHLPVYAEFELN